MPNHAEVPSLRIPAYMTLEQAMGEVRRYLDAKSQAAAIAASAGSLPVASADFSLQGAFIARLSEIASRLGSLETNSKLGALGVFLKRVVRKLIGWYSRPVYEFDRTVIETFQQLRQDMSGLQQQIATVQHDIAIAAPTRVTTMDPTAQSELLGSVVELFKKVVAEPALRQVLQQQRPALLQEVQRLLENVESELPSQKTARLSEPAPNTNR